MDSNINSKPMLIHTLNCMVISTIDSSVKSMVWSSCMTFCSVHTLQITPGWQRDSSMLVHIFWVMMTFLMRRSWDALLHGSRLFHWAIRVCFLRSGLITCFIYRWWMVVRSTGISTDISTARSNGHNGEITIVMNRSMVTSPVSRLVKTSVVLLYHYSCS